MNKSEFFTWKRMENSWELFLGNLVFNWFDDESWESAWERVSVYYPNEPHCFLITLPVIEDVKMSGIDWEDAPKFCDAFIESCKINGEEASEEQLEELNDDGDFVYQQVQDWIH